jgi:hypothetical protein
MPGAGTLGAVALSEELELIAATAVAHAAAGERVTGVLAAEAGAGERLYLCSFEDGAGVRSWLALDAAGEPVADRAAVRDTASIAALCELAAEAAGGGDLEDLRARLVALRLSENPPGIEEAEEAALELERAVGVEPRVATAAYLDGVGAATRRLERALGGSVASPFAEAMKHGMGAVEVLVEEVERRYKLPPSA